MVDNPGGFVPASAVGVVRVQRPGVPLSEFLAQMINGSWNELVPGAIAGSITQAPLEAIETSLSPLATQQEFLKLLVAIQSVSHQLNQWHNLVAQIQSLLSQAIRLNELAAL